MVMRAWTVGPTWRGKDVFVICGGPSVKPELVARLRDRPNSEVIAINTSHLVAPWAGMLFFADDRWWRRELEINGAAILAFEGQIVTIAHHVQHEKLWHLKRIVPSTARPVATERTTVALEKTSLTGVLNLCIHKECKRIILVGADNRASPDGRIHHHAEYPWPRKDETWKNKTVELGLTVAPLSKAGIQVINASMVSTLPFWPKVDLGAWLDGEDSNAQG